MYKIAQAEAEPWGGQFSVQLRNGNVYEDWDARTGSFPELIAAVVKVVQKEAVRDLTARLQRAESERLLLLIHTKRYLIAREQNPRGNVGVSIRSFYDLVNRMEASLTLARADWLRRYDAAGGVNPGERWPEAGIDWLLKAPEVAARLACAGEAEKVELSIRALGLKDGQPCAGVFEESGVIDPGAWKRLGLKDGEPCGHPGCLNHITHPCEGCGRIGGRSNG